MRDIIDTIIHHEGLRLAVYDDATGNVIESGSKVKGNPTIGVGRLLTAGRGITKEEARYLLNNDLEIVSQELDKNKPFWRTLPDNAQIVVMSMTFNCGYPRYAKFKKHWKCLEAKDWYNAGLELESSVWWGQVGRRGPELQQLLFDIT